MENFEFENEIVNMVQALQEKRESKKILRKSKSKSKK